MSTWRSDASVANAPIGLAEAGSRIKKSLATGDNWYEIQVFATRTAQDPIRLRLTKVGSIRSLLSLIETGTAKTPRAPRQTANEKKIVLQIRKKVLGALGALAVNYLLFTIHHFTHLWAY